GRSAASVSPPASGSVWIDSGPGALHVNRPPKGSGVSSIPPSSSGYGSLATRSRNGTPSRTPWASATPTTEKRPSSGSSPAHEVGLGDAARGDASLGRFVARARGGRERRRRARARRTGRCDRGPEARLERADDDALGVHDEHGPPELAQLGSRGQEVLELDRGAVGVLADPHDLGEACVGR